MLDVFIAYRNQRYLPKAWQVISSKGHTEDDGIKVNKGRKTFPCVSAVSKALALDVAMSWASAKYGVDSWCRIEGFGNTVFPLSVAEELKRVIPDVVYTKIR